MLMVFAVMIPYLGFVVYISARYSPGQWPTWLPYTLPIWFTANIGLIALLSRKLLRGGAENPERARNAMDTSVRIAIRLTILWSLFFLYGVYGVVRGRFPLNRAIPAGAFLLLFIGIFGWYIYGARRRAG
jgi:hypothetical protein